MGFIDSGPNLDDPNVIPPNQQEWYQRFKRDEFQDSHNNASFKSVPFIIEGDEGSFGRRVIVHQFPQRDIPYAEDLGRQARKFIIEGMLLGDDYLTQRDRLVSVCESDGAGELIHPYYGVLEVVCEKIQISNTRRNTRICLFQATFVETGKNTFPTITTDTTAAVQDVFNTSFVNQRSAFLDAYNTVKKQVIYLEGVKSVLNATLDAIVVAKKFADMPAEFFRSVDAAYAKVDAIVASSEDLFDTVVGLITSSIDLLDSAALRKLFEGFNVLKDEPVEDATDAQSDDSALLKNLVQESTVISMALISSLLEYESTNEAKAIRDTIFNKLDEILELELESQVEQDFRDLRKVVEEDIAARSLELPQLVDYTPAASIPALVISNTLYGSVEQEADIIARNSTIEHPGFVPGSQSIEVLLNA